MVPLWFTKPSKADIGIIRSYFTTHCRCDLLTVRKKTKFEHNRLAIGYQKKYISPMKKYEIAIVPGDGIGHEIVPAGIEVLNAVAEVSRSDSTMRGHFPAEVDALAQALGQENAVRIIIPFFLEGGRYTINDVHYVREGEFLIDGNGGSIRLYTDCKITIQSLGQPEREHKYKHEKRNFSGDCCYFTQRHFIDHLIDGKPFETNGPEYLKTLAVQDAVCTSAEQKIPVEVYPVRDSKAKKL